MHQLRTFSVLRIVGDGFAQKGLEGDEGAFQREDLEISYVRGRRSVNLPVTKRLSGYLDISASSCWR